MVVHKRPNQIKVGNIYCSQDCYGKSCTILINCEVCGNPIKSGLNKKTCNRICANKKRIGSFYKNGRPLKDKVKTIESLKVRLIELHGNSCSRCKYNKLSILHVHHIIEKSKGGSDDINNVELICPNCHAEEHYLRRL